MDFTCVSPSRRVFGGEALRWRKARRERPPDITRRRNHDQEASIHPACADARAPLSFTAAFAQTAPVELTFWDMKWGGDTYIATAQKLTDQFNAEHPEIHVNYQSIVWDNYYQTFLTAVTGGAAPDVSTGAFPQAVQYAQMGEILDLTPILEKWKAENDPILKDFTSESMVTMESYDGLLAGLPWNSDPRQIWYNKKAFEEAGITALPTTWDEFLATCQADQGKDQLHPLHLRRRRPHGHPVRHRPFHHERHRLLATPRAPARSPRPKKAVECLSFLGDLVKNGYVPEGIAGYTGDNSNLLYLSGKAAMTWTSPLNNLSEYPGMAEITDALPPLKGPSARSRPELHLAQLRDGLLPDQASRRVPRLPRVVGQELRPSTLRAT